MQYYAALLLAIVTAAALPRSIEVAAAAAKDNSIQQGGPTRFALLGSNGRYARLDTMNSHSNALKFDSQSLGNRPEDATVFDVGQDGSLAVAASSSFHFGGYQAMQATSAGTTAVVFEHPNSANSGYTPLACRVHDTSNLVKCTVGEHQASSGAISKAREWHLGGESGPQFSVKAVPVTDQPLAPNASESTESMSPVDVPGDQVVLR